MAVEPITPSTAEIVFPAQPHADYPKEVGRREKFPDPQNYTIWQIYGMVETALKAAGVPDVNVSFPWFLFHFRETINDYSAEIGELQKALSYEGGGGVFKVPHLRDVVNVSVNGYRAMRIAEETMVSYRAAELTTAGDQWFYSINGNLLSLYPAIESDDDIIIFATVFAEDFNEDAANNIIPQGDAWILYHGTLYRCLENQQKPFGHEKEEYLQGRASRKSRVARHLYPTRVSPYPL